MFDRLVFIEGPSDEAIIREWASTLGINLTRANVGFIPIAGARNFGHFATQSTLSFLTKRQVGAWFLIDRDEKDEPDIAKLQQMLGENGKLYVLTKREIENYLLCPRAILELIRLKKETGGKRDQAQPTEDEVVTVIRDCADKLKPVTVSKRVERLLCRPIFPSRNLNVTGQNSDLIRDKFIAEFDRIIAGAEESKRTIEAIYNEQTSTIDNIWDAQRLNIVPGDLLLDGVLQHYGLRFRKDKDGATLARLMREHEIEQEIKNLLAEIGEVSGRW